MELPPDSTLMVIGLTALITALVTLVVTKAGDGLLRLLAIPISAVFERLWRWMAPRIPRLRLWRYRRSLVADLSRIDNPVGPSLAVSLDKVFAPLKLISSDVPRGVDFVSYAAKNSRFIVLGGPGTGKTTLMKNLVTSVARQMTPEGVLNELFPVYVKLRSMSAKGQSIKEAITYEFEQHHFPKAEHFVASALDEGKLLVVLDGLEEVGPARASVAREIEEFLRIDKLRAIPNRVIVTCREQSYRSRDLSSALPDIVRIEPFADHHMRVFLAGWPIYRGRAAVNLYPQIETHAQIHELCRNPLLLTILTGLYLDTDNFSLPSSRERFYEAAIEELLVQRPSRRHLHQAFRPEEKLRILERVSLETLEIANSREDSGELRRGAILTHARNVLGREFDFQKLLDELVEVNGVIKPTGEEGFTLAHLTFQEYLAAKELRRVRDTNGVIGMHKLRPELSEVLLFYCSLTKNVPQVSALIDGILNENAQLAGQCIRNSTEAPARATVESVVEALYRAIPSASAQESAEILVFLAQRLEPEFELARQRLSDAINGLLAGTDAASAATLISILRSAPARAMELVPVLLQHESQDLRRGAVGLLKDIGTDGALDELVRLLRSQDEISRVTAATTLAGLVETRRTEIKRRIALFPEPKRKDLWTFEDILPSKVALSIAENLDPQQNGTHSLLGCARRAIEEQSAGSETTFLHQWKSLRRDLALNRTRLRIALAMAFSGTIALLSIGFYVPLVHLITFPSGRILIVQCAPLQIVRIESSEMIEAARIATALREDIEARYRPKAMGVNRLLPWNWAAEPLLSESALATYHVLVSVSTLVDPAQPIEVADLNAEVLGLDLDSVESLRRQLGIMRSGLPALEGDCYLASTCPAFGVSRWPGDPVIQIGRHILLILMVVLPMLRTVRVVGTYKRLRLQKDDALRAATSSSAHSAMMLMAIVYVFLYEIQGPWIVKAWLGVGCLGLMTLGGLVAGTRWPRNPLIDAISEFGPGYARERPPNR